MAKENKKDNLPSVVTGTQLYETRKNRPVITSNLSFDIACSGGIPKGCTVLCGGKYKSGKTTLALKYLAAAQKLFKMKGFVYNIEGRLDNKVLDQTNDLELDNLSVISGSDIKDENGEVVGNKKQPAQWWWDIIGENLTNFPGSFHIVDSISALSDESELAETMGYQSRGGLQKLEAQFCRKFGDIIVPSGTIIFLLAQIQANTSGQGEATQIKAGNSIRHLADAIIFIKWIEKWQPNSDGKILGHNLKCKIESSPLGSPYMECDVPLRYGVGIDNVKDVMNHCINWEIIKANGAWYDLPFLKPEKETDKPVFVDLDKLPKDTKPIKLQGEENVRSWLVSHPSETAMLEGMIRKQVLG